LSPGDEPGRTEKHWTADALGDPPFTLTATEARELAEALVEMAGGSKRLSRTAKTKPSASDDPSKKQERPPPAVRARASFRPMTAPAD